MKLTDPQIAQIKEQIGADPVPAESPATELLTKHFGKHTFYVDEAGLQYFEAIETPKQKGARSVQPVRVADWADEKRDSLAPHEPVVGSVSVVIDIEE